MIGPWWRKRDGATAVEFSLLALPMIILIIGTIEVALIFTTQSLLDASVSTAARLIRTGQIQQSGGNHEEMFRQAMCDYASILIPCAKIQFQVQDLDNFGQADNVPPPEFDEEGNLQGQGFSPGDVNSVVLIRVAYPHTIMTPMMQPMLTNRGDGTRLLMATIVMQNEPYRFDDER